MILRHVVLTRAAYGPAWDLEANRRRLAMTAGVTARLMAAQTERRLTWIVLVDCGDPLRAEREAVVRESGLDVEILEWDSGAIVPAPAPWDTAKSTTLVQRIAATAYRAPWAAAIGDRSRPTIVTRIDDDDGFTPDAMARVRARAEVYAERVAPGQRIALIMPVGIRVWAGREAAVRHPTNAMSSLLTAAGDAATVYDFGHRRVGEFARVRFVDQAPGWLWVRHRDTISGHRIADGPITARTRRLFPIDWTLVA